VIRHAILAAGVFALATPAAAAPTNLIANPGFESGSLAPWVNARDASNPFNPVEFWNVTSTDARTGSFSAQALENVEIRQDFAAVAVEQILELSFWLRHPVDTETPAAISLFYSDGSEGFSLAITEGLDWEFFDITADLEAGKFLTGFGLFGYTPGAEARTRLDDVTLLVNVPTPAGLGLLGAAAGLLAFSRVRRQA